MKYVTMVNDKTFEIEILDDGSLTVNGVKRDVDFRALGPAMYSILAQNISHELTIEQRDENIEVLMKGHLYVNHVLDERALLMAQRSGGLGGDSGEINMKSPMPGLIVTVKVEVGQAVKAGETVIILESMKMQNELKAARDGVIAAVHVAAGQSVEQNKLMLVIQ